MLVGDPIVAQPNTPRHGVVVVVLDKAITHAAALDDELVAIVDVLVAEMEGDGEELAALHANDAPPTHPRQAATHA